MVRNIWNMVRNVVSSVKLGIFLFFVLSCCILLIRSELPILRNRILKITLETNRNKFLGSSRCLILIMFFYFIFNMLLVFNCRAKDPLPFAKVGVSL